MLDRQSAFQPGSGQTGNNLTGPRAAKSRRHWQKSELQDPCPIRNIFESDGHSAMPK